jgi:SAM-dependent methyltransferase
MSFLTVDQHADRRSLAAVGRFLRLAKWSLRKLQLRIGPNALVLDVGSGSNPHPRADVLLERYESGVHRHGTSAVFDRPAVFADACRMPFRDKTFDYVIAFHVLEHVPTPETFLRELSRVAKAGYIETPNAIFDKLAPYDVHCLEIMNIDNRLVINKKRAGCTDAFIAGLTQQRDWNTFFYSHPEYFHIRYHWTDHIDFTVTNPEESCSWHMKGEASAGANGASHGHEGGGGSRSRALQALRRFYQLKRKDAFSLRSLLVCPACHGDLADRPPALFCQRCGVSYGMDPWPTFT